MIFICMLCDFSDFLLMEEFILSHIYKHSPATVSHRPKDNRLWRFATQRNPDIAAEVV
jgi:hypothetical protein